MAKLILAAVLSSALYVFSFSPWSHELPILSHLQWIAWVPLLSVLSKKNASYGQTFLAGFTMAAGIALGGFYWIIHATQQYGGLPLPAAILVFLLFCGTSQLQIPLYLLVRKKALTLISPHRWIFISGLVYVGIESFYPKLFLDTAGHAFADSLTFSQLADLGGVSFITTLILLFSESVVAVIQGYRKWIFTPLLILILGGAYGTYRIHQLDSLLETTRHLPQLRFSLIQANIGDYLKIAAEQGYGNASDTVIGEYLKFSTESLKNEPDAIIWPETAYSTLFGKPQREDERRMEDRLREFSSRYPGTLIFGGYDQDEKSLDYNSLFFLNQTEASTRSSIPTYHKSILLMFGETLPFSDFFPSMKSWFPTMGFFGSGPGPQVFTVLNREQIPFKFAPSICYEGLFSDFISDGALLGADALLNVTNDSWFGAYGEPHLHFALTRFRTIETRLPLIRSTNTGISAVVDALGRIEKQTGIFKSDVLSSSIRQKLNVTSPYLFLASRLSGHWYERLTQLFTLGLLIWMSWISGRFFSRAGRRSRP